MMTRIVQLSLQRKALVVVIAAALMAVGFVQVGENEVDTLPEFLPPIVEVQTEALGLSAAEVEQLITVPLEADLLNGVAWLESIRSESMPSLSSIVMQFEPGTDLLQARQVVQERLTQAHGLPNVSRAPAMVQPLSSESRVMMIGLSSDEVSLIDMSVLARWTVRPFLMGVKGVANVSVWGQRERQLQVHVDPETIAEEEVTLQDIVNTTGNALWVSPLSYLEASTPGVGGFIDGPNQRIGIQHVLSISNPADLAAVTIEDHEDLTLGEVTTVVEDHQPLIGDAIVDEGPGLLLIVDKFPWSNTVDTTQAVEDALEELAPGLTGIQVDTDLFRPASYIERSVDNVQTTAIVSLILVIVALFALFYSWRGAVISLVAIVASLMLAGLVFWAAELTVNTVVLAGFVLALGLLIDDSIGDVAAVRDGLASEDDDRRDTTILTALVRARRPLFYATAVMVVALVPALVMEGAAGEFLPTVGLAMIVALAASIIVGMTLTPALCALLYRGSSGPTESPVLTALRRGFDKAASPLARSPRIAFGVVAVLVLLGVGLIPTLDRDYVPEFKQTDLLIRFDGAAGTSLQETSRVATLVAGELRDLAGVGDVGAHVGRAVLSDEIVNVNSSELWVKIDPDADYGGTVNGIREVVQGYPGYGAPETVSYSNERVDDVLRQSTRDLVVRVYGEQPGILGPLANDIAQLVRTIDGTENVRALHPLAEPAIEIEVDLEEAGEFEIKPGDVRRAAATLLSGIEVGSFFEEQKVFEVVVWSDPGIRHSVTSVEELQIGTPSGDVVELASIADVRVAPNENVIVRDAVSRYIDVVADVSGRSLGAVEADITDAIEQRGLPFEYHVRILDDRNDANANQRQFVVVSIAAAITIFLVLQAAFGSWRRATMLFLTTPLALAGGIVALTISGGTYSIGSSVGLFAVYGITLRLGVSLIERWDSLQLDEGMSPGPELVARGLSDRFAPTVMSLLVTGLAMLPILVFGDIAGQEVVRPTSIVIFGGVVGSAIVTLFVLPAMYGRFAGAAIPHESLSATESV
ncbi:MAG: efflux RND transporter permease subunit [Acidimicrobiales bacterium]